MKENIKRQINIDRYFGFRMQTEKNMKNFLILNILNVTQNMDLKEQDVLAAHMVKNLMMN